MDNTDKSFLDEKADWMLSMTNMLGTEDDFLLILTTYAGCTVEQAAVIAYMLDQNILQQSRDKDLFHASFFARRIKMYGGWINCVVKHEKLSEDDIIDRALKLMRERHPHPSDLRSLNRYLHQSPDQIDHIREVLKFHKLIEANEDADGGWKDQITIPTIQMVDRDGWISHVARQKENLAKLNHIKHLEELKTINEAWLASHQRRWFKLLLIVGFIGSLAAIVSLILQLLHI